MMSFKTFDCYTNFKDGNVFGENNTFGRFSSFGNNNSFGDDNVFDDYTLFGNGNAFGRYTVFGRYAQVGDDTVLGACATIGECFEFGKRLTMEDEVNPVPHPDTVRLDFLIKNGAYVEPPNNVHDFYISRACACYGKPYRVRAVLDMVIDKKTKG